MKKNKFENWLISFIKGMGIGIAVVIPGVSGGTAAVLLKCYDTIVNAVSKLFKQFGKSFITLLPIALGCIIAIIPMWFAMKLATDYFLFAIVTLFAGLIIGGSPSIIDEVRVGGKPKVSYIIVAIITCVVAVAMGVVSILFYKCGGYDVQNLFDEHPWWLFLLLIPVGMLASFALIIPGISGSLLLLVIGFYTPIINIPSKIFDNSMDVLTGLGLLCCLALGVLVGFFLFSKLMAYMLSKHRTITFYGILGFILGSLAAIYLNQETWKYYEHGVQIWEFIVAGVLLIVGVVGSYLIYVFAKKEDEKKSIIAEGEKNESSTRL